MRLFLGQCYMAMGQGFRGFGANCALYLQESTTVAATGRSRCTYVLSLSVHLCRHVLSLTQASLELHWFLHGVACATYDNVPTVCLSTHKELHAISLKERSSNR